jgi:hypothetical protein
MRTIAFVGGEYVPGSSGNVCRYNRGSFFGFLDDCNQIKAWTAGPTTNGSPPTDGQPGGGAMAYNGSFLGVGGGNGSAMQYQVLFNNGQPGIIRTGSADNAEVRPGTPDGIELYKGGGGQPYVFPVVVPYTHLVANNGFVYAIGGEMAGNASPCQRVYRTRLASTTWWVDAGSWLSPPYDLGTTVKMTRVSWSYTKSGPGAADDWAMLRYRVYPDQITKGWSCWTPRVPEDGSAPSVPGYITYASDVPGSNPFYRMPLAPNPFQYIQFEVSLYNNVTNDAGVTPTLPRFDEFRISYDDVALPPPLKAGCPLEVYPNPARDGVSVRFEVAPEGAEVTVEFYNAAAELVDREHYSYLDGGIKTEIVPVSRWSSGAYIIIVKGLARIGGPGLYCTSTRVRRNQLKEQFVVRH